jgi:hypothetical protein
MGTSLKDALLKVGLQATTAPKKVPRENERPKPPPSVPVTQDQKNQEVRNFCEVCETICPDVELYNHRIPSLKARWICCRCADIQMIPDSVRQTAQSDVAKKNIFKREFGETRRIIAPRPAPTNTTSGRPVTPVRGNSGDRGDQRKPPQGQERGQRQPPDNRRDERRDDRKDFQSKNSRGSGPGPRGRP